MRYGFVCLLLLALAACAPEATPFPVDMPTPVIETPIPSVPPPIRYALHPNTEGYVAEMDMLTAAAQVEQLAEPINPDDLGNRYDLVAAYGEWSGWTRSPITPHAALIINTHGNPLNSPVLAAIVRRSPQPEALLTDLNLPGVVADVIENDTPQTLRTELANRGYPDGLELTLGHAYVPGVDSLSTQLHKAGINNRPLLLSQEEIRTALDEGWLHLALVTWQTPEEREQWTQDAGMENVLDLYILPISYRTLPELTITFSPGGWPIATH
jgi:hypothetical protein